MSVIDRRRLCCLAAVGLLPALIVTGSAAAQPRPHVTKVIHEQSLSIQQNRVKTSTSKTLNLEVIVEREPGHDQTATVALTTRGLSESHSWTFLLGTGALKTKSSGAATFKTASRIQPYGSLDLTITPTGTAKRTTVCDADNYVLLQPEKVKGTIRFNTHSTGKHAWGKITFVNRPLRTATADLTTTYGSCAPKHRLIACSTGVTWEAFGGLTLFGTESAAGRSSTVVAQREVALAAPKFSLRTDFIVAKEPVPKLKRTGSSAQLKITTRGAVMHGSGTLNSRGKAKTSVAKCRTGTDTFTEWSASFTPDHLTLRASEQVFGTIRLPTRHSGHLVLSKA